MPEFLLHLPEKLTLHDISPKISEFTRELPEKYFPEVFLWGRGHAPLCFPHMSGVVYYGEVKYV